MTEEHPSKPPSLANVLEKYRHVFDSGALALPLDAPPETLASDQDQASAHAVDAAMHGQDVLPEDSPLAQIGLRVVYGSSGIKRAGGSSIGSDLKVDVSNPERLAAYMTDVHPEFLSDDDRGGVTLLLNSVVSGLYSKVCAGVAFSGEKVTEEGREDALEALKAFAVIAPSAADKVTEHNYEFDTLSAYVNHLREGGIDLVRAHRIIDPVSMFEDPDALRQHMDPQRIRNLHTRANDAAFLMIMRQGDPEDSVYRFAASSARKMLAGLEDLDPAHVPDGAVRDTLEDAKMKLRNTLPPESGQQ